MYTLSAADELYLPGDSNSLHVLDLPQVHNKPPASSLLAVLSQLTLYPATWDPKSESENALPSINEDGIPSYLTRIISSALDWINSEDEREDIWEAASARLAERSGRSALPSFTRTFAIPTISARSDSSETVDIAIYEPSLTGDNLGHKTWVASYLLAKRLPKIFQDGIHRHLDGRNWGIDPTKTAYHNGKGGDSHNIHAKIASSANPNQAPNLPSPCTLESSKSPNSSSSTKLDPPSSSLPRILELGAGTGLVGLSFSALCPTPSYIHLTDLTSIVPNLTHNIHLNQSLTHKTQSTVTTGILDWSTLHPKLKEKERYNIILAADSLYMSSHAAWLARTMDAYLSKSSAYARIYVELPFRAGMNTTEEFHEQYKGEMAKCDFEVEDGGEEIGYDDWTDSATGDGMAVRCWWSVWRRCPGR